MQWIHAHENLLRRKPLFLKTKTSTSSFYFWHDKWMVQISGCPVSPDLDHFLQASDQRQEHCSHPSRSKRRRKRWKSEASPFRWATGFKGGSNLISCRPCQGLLASLSVFILSHLSLSCQWLGERVSVTTVLIVPQDTSGRKRSDIIEHPSLDYTFLLTSGLLQSWHDNWFLFAPAYEDQIPINTWIHIFSYLYTLVGNLTVKGASWAPSKHCKWSWSPLPVVAEHRKTSRGVRRPPWCLPVIT